MMKLSSLIKSAKAKMLAKRVSKEFSSESPLSYRGLTVPVSKDFMPRPIFEQIFHNKYEVPELEAATELMVESDRLLEMGTGLGIISGILGKTFPRCEILSFEANPNLLPHISKLHKMNGITNVTVRNRLLEPNPSVETRVFHLHQYFSEGSVLKSELSRDTIDIQVEDLNKVIRDFQPNVIMCDIEGAEETVIANADLDGIRALILELHPKMISRGGVKAIFDNCAKHGLYPCVEYSSEQVVSFERVE